MFLLEHVDLGTHWAMDASVRHDAIDNKLADLLRSNGANMSGSASFGRTTARVGLAWMMSPKLSLYANWGQGYLPPATEELANNPAQLGGFNLAIKPSTSQGEEVGLRGALEHTVSYNFAVYHVATKNDFDRFRVASRPLETFYRNAGSTRRYGAESYVGWHPFDALNLRLAYSYSNYKYTSIDSLFGTFANHYMPNAPVDQLSTDIQYVLAEHWVFGVDWQAVSKAYVDQTNQATAPAYTILSPRAGFRWWSPDYRGDILVQARNVLDSKYIAFTEPDPDGNSYQPGPTREVFATMKLSLY